MSIFQALLLNNINAGIVGNSIVAYLSPFIGNAGLWIFILIGLVITLIVFLEHKHDEISANLKNLLIGYKPKDNVVQRDEYVAPVKTMKPREKREERVSVKEVGDTAEIFLSPVSVINDHRLKIKKRLLKRLLRLKLKKI